jgi:hypothetical protein
MAFGSGWSFRMKSFMFSTQGDFAMREREWMKRIVAAIAITIMMMPCICGGEEKLLITDVLEKGEREVVATFSYFHESQEISFQGVRLNADRTVEAFYSNYGFNVGLGHGLEVGAGIPYVFSDRTKIQDPTIPATTYRFSREGFGDISLGGTYLVFDETDKPFTLVAGLDVKLETASEDDGGTGTTNIAPYVAASTTVAEGIRPTASYSFVARDHGSRDSHQFAVGAEKELNEDVGLGASLAAVFNTSSDFFESFESYSLRISSYIRICRNFYAIPKVIYETYTSADEKDRDRRWGSAKSLTVGYGLYCLF